MKKLIVALVLVALLTLPIAGLAGPPETIPPKPGTKENPGLSHAAYWGAIMSNGANWIGVTYAWWLWANFPPPPE